MPLFFVSLDKCQAHENIYIHCTAGSHCLKHKPIVSACSSTSGRNLITTQPVRTFILNPRPHNTTRAGVTRTLFTGYSTSHAVEALTLLANKPGELIVGSVASLAVVWKDDGYFKTGDFVYDSLPIQK